MIHHFDGNHWLPGSSRCDGNKPFPDHPKAGTFFNDVTGVQGRSADEVAENLPELLMKQGTLAQILKTPFDWRGFMGRIQKRIANLKKPIIPMVDVVIHPNETVEVLPHDGWDAALVDDAARLAFSLVRANGQMDFIRGAARSEGGKPIIALPSTAAGGTVSRIVRELSPGAGVVTMRAIAATLPATRPATRPAAQPAGRRAE